MFKRGSSVRNKFTHQANAIHLWVLSHIFGYPPIFHPITNNFERWRCLGGNSKERNDVWMRQPLPYNNFFIEYLASSSPQQLLQATGNLPTNLVYGTSSILRVRSQNFDADLFPVEFCFVYIGKPSCGKRLRSIRKLSALNEVGRWEGPPVAARGLQPT